LLLSHFTYPRDIDWIGGVYFIALNHTAFQSILSTIEWLMKESQLCSSMIQSYM
jgi:hypothetical protein